jgi:hypothetical protein
MTAKGIIEWMKIPDFAPLIWAALAATLAGCNWRNTAYAALFHHGALVYPEAENNM